MEKTKKKEKDKKTKAKQKDDGIITIGLYALLGISLICMYLFDGIAFLAKFLANVFRSIYNYIRPSLKVGDRNASKKTRT